MHTSNAVELVLQDDELGKVFKMQSASERIKRRVHTNKQLAAFNGDANGMFNKIDYCRQLAVILGSMIGLGNLIQDLVDGKIAKKKVVAALKSACYKETAVAITDLNKVTVEDTKKAFQDHAPLVNEGARDAFIEVLRGLHTQVVPRLVYLFLLLPGSFVGRCRVVCVVGRLM